MLSSTADTRRAFQRPRPYKYDIHARGNRNSAKTGNYGSPFYT